MIRNVAIVAACLTLAACLTVGAPAVALAGDQAIRVSASDKAACMPDALRYCRDAVPNVHNVLACFSRNRSKLSGRCNAVLASYGL